MLRERELVHCSVFKARCTEAVNTTSEQICQGILMHLSVRGKKINKFILCDRVTSVSPVILTAGVYNNSRHFELARRLLPAVSWDDCKTAQPSVRHGLPPLVLFVSAYVRSALLSVYISSVLIENLIWGGGANEHDLWHHKTIKTQSWSSLQPTRWE